VNSHRALSKMELERCQSLLSQVVRVRTWEAEQAGGEARGTDGRPLEEAFLLAGTVAPEYPGQGVSKILKDAAKEIEQDRLYYDLSKVNDPVSNRAHAHWRRSSNDRRYGAISTECFILITDIATGGATTISLFVGAVLLLTYAVGFFTFDRWSPWAWHGGMHATISQPQAIIAVLLLVPGFLFSRLDLPVPDSIAARLRLLPRIAAYVSVGSVTLLAAYIATSPDTVHLARAFRWILLVQAISFAFLGARLIGRTRARRRRTVRDLFLAEETPAWFHANQANRWAIVERIDPRRWFRTIRSKPDVEYKAISLAGGEQR